MMDLVPEKVEGCVVFNVKKSCRADRDACGLCLDYSTAVHNWLKTSEMPYMILDLQDEKEICAHFLEELLQLWKRLRIPFYFVGVMERPMEILSSYAYHTFSATFGTPDEAVSALRKSYPETMDADLSGVEFGKAIQVVRPKPGEAEEEEKED